MKNLADKTINELITREAKDPCARCGTASFSCLGKFINLLIGDGARLPIMTKNVAPCAVVYCENCGAVTLHLLGVLGLLGEDTTEPNHEL